MILTVFQVPFRYNVQPAVPEVHMTNSNGQAGPDSSSEHFQNFEHSEDQTAQPSRPGYTNIQRPQTVSPSRPGYATVQRPYPSRPLRAEVLDDWSSKVITPFSATSTSSQRVSQSTDGKQNVRLDTKYFSLSYPEVR